MGRTAADFIGAIVWEHSLAARDNRVNNIILFDTEMSDAHRKKPKPLDPCVSLAHKPKAIAKPHTRKSIAESIVLNRKINFLENIFRKWPSNALSFSPFVGQSPTSARFRLYHALTITVTPTHFARATIKDSRCTKQRRKYSN